MLPHRTLWLQVLTSWGQQHCFHWSVGAPVGPLALTPLHVAAATRSVPLVQTLYGELRACGSVCRYLLAVFGFPCSRMLPLGQDRSSC